ncbi:MAG: hypothetical protein COU69_01620 [Candidatus Pacebacteria bacterium CG10_big_fil_rev_8_21_14_0_10_56_10]|nr:MAG: hypothetical protein COU69_01620 [Candidatus Pacebacteria bacterium CG10_big_fil_rev_8_21_14_0_10_56_10]
MSIFQVIAVLFALFMLYVVNIHRRRSRLSGVEVSFWYSTWFLFIVIALFPDLLLELSGILRFSRVFDLLVVVGMMVQTVLVISNYLVQKENRRKLEDVVRQIALKKYDSRSQSNSQKKT